MLGLSILILGCWASLFLRAAAFADDADDSSAASHEKAVVMRRFIVSATRIEKSPWRYASLPGIEVLSRAPEEETNWELDALKRGLMFQNVVIPNDWYPQSSVPYTVIIDDTNLDDVPVTQIHLQPIVFRPPADALRWGDLSDRAEVSTDIAEAFDEDTYAINANVYGVPTENMACASSGIERLLDSSPPLPAWLTAGLLGRDNGIIRQGFALVSGKNEGPMSSSLTLIQRVQRAAGPGTLWVSLDETEQLLKQLRKDKRTRIEIPPLGELFGEAPPSDEGRPLWESEAGLFARWALLGPGRDDPGISRAFLELVRRARREPVTERVFVECFGFGYSKMQEKLEKFLKTVLAKPTSVKVLMPLGFPSQVTKLATADQIGRILGDWLRMQGNAHRMDPGLRWEFLEAAGGMLERAYRDDNGLPPGMDPSRGGERTASSSENGASGSAVVLEPFVVTADRIHDPRLLAVYGLYEHDSGDDTKARELLEAAVKTGVVRPKAYVVLAELRYSEALAAPLGSKARLSVEQSASILGPLQTALAYAPTSEIYSRIVEVWGRCEAKPADSDIKTIVEGVMLFPRDTALSYSSAHVCAKGGYNAEAGRLIDRGLLFATHEDDRSRFEQLRSELLLSTLAVPSLPMAK